MITPTPIPPTPTPPSQHAAHNQALTTQCCRAWLSSTSTCACGLRKCMNYRRRPANQWRDPCALVAVRYAAVKCNNGKEKKKICIHLRERFLRVHTSVNLHAPPPPHPPHTACHHPLLPAMAGTESHGIIAMRTKGGRGRGSEVRLFPGALAALQELYTDPR